MTNADDFAFGDATFCFFVAVEESIVSLEVAIFFALMSESL